MVVDTTYYELLEVEVTATQLDIKRAYRKAAIKLHPDKNPDDPQAAARFQEVGEAYQVLSDEKLREKYNKFGKQDSVPTEGFEDPTEFFSMIFGGEAFKDWIGELSLLQEMSKTAELSGMGDEEEAATEAKSTEPDTTKSEAKSEASETKAGTTAGTAGTAGTSAGTAGTSAGTAGTAAEPKTGPAAESDSKTTLLLESGTQLDKDPLTKEEREKQRRQEELEKFEEECRVKKIETRNELAKKLADRLALFTETDMADDVAELFRQKMRYEAELLKMESFGLEILHTLGNIYKTKAKILLKSQSILGSFGGFWWTLKDKGGVVRDTFNTVSSALSAQLTMQEFAKMQEDNEYHARKEAEEQALKQAQQEAEALEEQLRKVHVEQEMLHGDAKPDGEKEKKEKEPEKHTEDELREMEQYLVGKFLAAAWSGSKFEIVGTVRAVCDQLLDDKDVPLEKRLARAKGLRIIGKVFAETTRTELEAEEARMFEELVAKASQKPKKKKKKAAEPTDAATA